MEELSRSMRAAVDTVPPTRIDLDDLIRQGYRDRGRHRAAWAVASVAGTVAAVITATMLLGPASSTAPQLPGASPGLCAAVRPTPSSSQDASFDGITAGTAPAPTEPEADAVARLSEALTDVLATNLPGRTVTDQIHPGCTSIQVEPKIYPARYYASADISGTDAFLVIMITEKDYPGLEWYPDKETLADGTVIGYLEGGTQVAARRTDGTSVTVILYGDGDVTQEELLAIAADPRLTLYP